MSPDQFLIWGATRLPRNNRECAGIISNKLYHVKQALVLLCDLFPSCLLALLWYAIEDRPPLLSQWRQGIGFSNLPMLRLSSSLSSFSILLALVSRPSGSWPTLGKTLTSKNDLCKGLTFPSGDYLVPDVWVTLPSVVMESLLKSQDLCYLKSLWCSG